MKDKKYSVFFFFFFINGCSSFNGNLHYQVNTLAMQYVVEYLKIMGLKYQWISIIEAISNVIENKANLLIKSLSGFWFYKIPEVEHQQICSVFKIFFKKEFPSFSRMIIKTEYIKRLIDFCNFFENIYLETFMM